MGARCVSDRMLCTAESALLAAIPLTCGESRRVQFFAPWCGHCTMMAPAFNSLARTVHGEWQGAKVGNVNCDAHPELGNRFQITGYPTLGLIHKGKMVELYHGPKEMQAMFDFIKESVKSFHRLPNAKPPQVTRRVKISLKEWCQWITNLTRCRWITNLTQPLSHSTARRRRAASTLRGQTTGRMPKPTDRRPVSAHSRLSTA